MFLISKIVRGRRLLHELEAAQAAQKNKDEKESRGKDFQEGSNLSETDGTNFDYDNNLKLRRPSKGQEGISRIRSSKKSKPKNMSSSIVNSPKNHNNHIKNTINQQSLSVSQGGTINKAKGRNSVREKRSLSNKKRKNTTIGVVVTNESGVEKKTGRSVDGGIGSNGLALRRTSSMPSVCDDVSFFKASHYNYDAKLNRLQKRSLRFTWHRLQTKNGGKRVENVFEEVFDRLIKVIPSIKDMFATRAFLSVMSRNECSTIRDHARVTVKMIDVVIKNLDVEDNKRTDTGSSCDPRRVGAAHAPFRPYGITGHYWEKFGEMIIDVVLTQEAVRDLPGAGQAWVVLAACLVDQLRAGFEQKCSYLAYGSNNPGNPSKPYHKNSTPYLPNPPLCPFNKNQQYESNDNNEFNQNGTFSIESSRKNSNHDVSNTFSLPSTSSSRNKKDIFFRGMSDSTDDCEHIHHSFGRSINDYYHHDHAYSVDNQKLTLSDLQLSEIPSRNIVYNLIDPSKEIQRPVVRSPKDGNHSHHSSERGQQESSRRTNSNKSSMVDDLYHPMQNCLLSNDI
uniref:GLOBIN domain-containing protein n=1 Tax=Parastrongyloides trichosuri TaxID=131310 RepID=A0A0N4ZRH9_PARTI